MADVMIIVLIKTLEDGPQIDCAMICTIIIPQDLLLARCKSEIYASIKKNFVEKARSVVQGKFNALFVEAKALQERLRKLNRRREIDELKAF